MATAYVAWDRGSKTIVGGPELVSADCDALIRRLKSKSDTREHDRGKAYTRSIDNLTVTI